MDKFDVYPSYTRQNIRTYAISISISNKPNCILTEHDNILFSATGRAPDDIVHCSLYANGLPGSCSFQLPWLSRYNSKLGFASSGSEHSIHCRYKYLRCNCIKLNIESYSLLSSCRLDINLEFQCNLLFSVITII